VLAVLRTAAPPLELGRFWSLVGELGWGRRIHDADALALEIARLMDLDTCLAAGNRCALLDRELERAFAAWSLQTQQELGLDANLFRHLRQHLIGLGRAEFEAALRNPALAKHRGERDDYLESFGQAFHAALRQHSDEALEAALAKAAQPFTPDELRDGLVVAHAEHGLGVVREEPWANRWRASFRGGDLLVDRRPALLH
jgi:hypothetical protein